MLIPSRFDVSSVNVDNTISCRSFVFSRSRAKLSLRSHQCKWTGSGSICSCILLPVFPFAVEVGYGRTSAISRQKTLVCGRQVSDMS